MKIVLLTLNKEAAKDCTCISFVIFQNILNKNLQEFDMMVYHSILSFRSYFQNHKWTV